MRLKPLEQFICDYCHEVINNVEEGWVEWLTEITENGFRNYGFKIVHHALYSTRGARGHCYHYEDNPKRSDHYLHQFIQQHRLLRFLDEGPYHEPDYKGPSVENLREYVELLRRLTIPYYEEARLYWHEAMEFGFFEGENPISLYDPNTMKRLIMSFEVE
jgi:hypothetical protein